MFPAFLILDLIENLWKCWSKKGEMAEQNVAEIEEEFEELIPAYLENRW